MHFALELTVHIPTSLPIMFQNVCSCSANDNCVSILHYQEPWYNQIRNDLKLLPTSTGKISNNNNKKSSEKCVYFAPRQNFFPLCTNEDTAITSCELCVLELALTPGDCMNE